MIKWIIFDAMGVIFTVGDDTNDLLVPFILDRNSFTTREKINEIYLQASLGQISSRQFWAAVGLGDHYPEIEKTYLDTVTLDPGFIPVAKALSKRHCIALISNDVSEWSVYLRRKHLLDFLELTMVSGDIGWRKPDPEIFEHFLNESGARAAECIFIDDRSKNISAAKGVGLRTIHFQRQQQQNDFISGVTVSGFTELEAAIEDLSLRFFPAVCKPGPSCRGGSPMRLNDPAGHHNPMIRVMTIEDYDAVLALMQRTPGVTVREADSREATGFYLSRNPGLSFVASHEGRVVGCVMCGHDGRRGYLQHLIVETEFRNQGVGRRLWKCCLDELEKQGIFKTHLDVLVTNHQAATYWANAGWVKRDDIYRYSFNRSASSNA